jgi:hypothetical protein
MIKLHNTLIAEHRGSDNKTRRIVRGELDPDSIGFLDFDWYQRGETRPAKLKKLVRGVKERSEFPDIILAMRSGNISDLTNSAVLELRDRVYIVDGLQRVTAFTIAMEDDPSLAVHIGAKVFLDSDINFELDLFSKMNTNHTSMASSVILRNEKEHSRVAATLYGLSGDSAFMLADRVAWNQEADKSEGGELVRGVMLLRLLAAIHSHLLGAPSLFHRVLTLLEACDRRIDAVGLHQARLNLMAFFEMIDEVWGLRKAPVKYGSIYITDAWTQIIARILSNHRDFWHGPQLAISKDAIRDFKRINPSDPDLIALARGNRLQHELLYQTFLNIMNKGKSTNRYVDRFTLDKAEAAAERQQYSTGAPHYGAP